MLFYVGFATLLAGIIIGGILPELIVGMKVRTRVFFYAVGAILILVAFFTMIFLGDLERAFV